MPTNAEKLLERMRKSKTGWKRKDLEKLYEAFGFVIQSGRGPHDKVFHPEFSQLSPTSLPRYKRVHRYLVEQAIRLIDELQRLQKQRGE